MKRSEAWGIVACVAAAASSIALSWNQWLDPIIDAGRDLYVPLQLAGGAHLYRDLAYNYPPLAPYALAGLVRVFGSSLPMYIALGFVLAAIAATAIYFWARSLAGPAAAFAATFLFVTLCVAGRPNFNFFFPYAHAMTFGAALTIVFMAREGKLANVFGALACLTKPEFAAVVIVGSLVRRRWAAAVAFAVITALVTPFPSNVLHGASTFYQRMAFGDWQHMAIGAAIVACVAVLSNVPAAIWIAPVFVFVSADDLFAATPLVHLALIPVLRRRSQLLLPWAASLTSTARIALNVSPTHNGFAYVIPTIVLLVYAAFTLFPRPLWIALFAGVSLHALWKTPQPYVLVQTARGTYRDRDLARGRVMNELLSTLPPGSLIVIPEGISIDYFAGRRHPLRTYIFTPPEFDESVTRDFASHPPDLVLFVPRPVAEYGRAGFGIDYARSLRAFIDTHYEPARAYRDSYYTAQLWRRR